MGVTAMVLGASGFTGTELLRFLAAHPAMEVAVAAGGDHAGETVAAVAPHLRGAINLELVALDEALGAPVDVCFSCLPRGLLREHSGELAAPVVVDLAGDFRAERGWVYGLTEYARPRLAGARHIANPGCYPTAALLCLLPFACTGAITGPVTIDGLSGASGAGRGAEERLLFATLDENAMAYGSIDHRHVDEIERAFVRLAACDLAVSFTPHLVPMARGVLITARARLSSALSQDEATGLLRDAYRTSRFVDVTGDWPATKAVTGTNRAHVAAHVDARNDLLICSAAIDNLGKGAAGQAIQNANVALGIEEHSGLEQVGVWP